MFKPINNLLNPTNAKINPNVNVSKLPADTETNTKKALKGITVLIDLAWDLLT